MLLPNIYSMRDLQETGTLATHTPDNKQLCKGCPLETELHSDMTLTSRNRAN